MPTVNTPITQMGDAQFFEEFGTLDTLPQDEVSAFRTRTAPVLARVTLKPDPKACVPRPVADARGLGRQFMMPSEQTAAPPIVAAAKPSALHPAVAVVGFVLMMFLGAGAAVLVFHDRVEQLVVQWQAAGR